MRERRSRDSSVTSTRGARRAPPLRVPSDACVSNVTSPPDARARNDAAPPAFVTAEQQRGERSNPLDIKVDSIEAQREAYPDLQTLTTDLAIEDAFARALAVAGAEVSLVSGPTNLPVPHGVNAIVVNSATDMLEAVSQDSRKPLIEQLTMREYALITVVLASSILAGMTLLLLGAAMVLLGGGWHGVRRAIVAPFPKTGLIARIIPPEPDKDEAAADRR